MKAIALLGAPKTQWPLNLKQIVTLFKKNGDLVIGVDRGSLLIEEMGLIPDFAVGDFDSLKKTELAKIECDTADIRYSVPEKDLTDTELAVRYAFQDYHVETLTLVGSTGGRLDHFLTTLFMMLKPEFKPFVEKVEILDQQNSIKFYNSGKHNVKRLPNYTYFGIVPLTAVQNLKIVNAKYNLINFTSDYPVSLSSNEFLPKKSEFSLSFAKGIVAVIQSKDIIRYQNI